MTTEKDNRDFWFLNHYDVMFVKNKIKVIYPINVSVGTVRYYMMDSELFHILHLADLAIEHGGRDRMLKELLTKYKNVTCHDIELYIYLCEPCQKK